MRVTSLIKEENLSTCKSTHIVKKDKRKRIIPLDTYRYNKILVPS